MGAAKDRPAGGAGSSALVGLGSGLAGGLLLGGLEVGLCAPALGHKLPSTAMLLELLLRLLLLPLLPMLASGLLQSLLSALGRRLQSPRRLAALLVVLALPYIVWVVGEAFSGPHARTLPGRPLLMAGLGGAALGGLYGGLLLFWRRLDRLQADAGSRQRWGWTIGAALATTGLYLLDQRLLPRLYPWFHLSLALATLLAAQASGYLLLFGGGWRGPGSRRATGLGLLLLVGLGTLSGLSLQRLYRATVLRSLVLEQTTVAAKLMLPYARLRSRRPRPLPTAPPSLETAHEAPPSYSGPRLSGRDVFLITIDALRADRLQPQYMPFASRLAARGVRFERGYTQVPHTSFAVATLLTSKPVYALMALGHEAASHETLPLVLRRFRYKTAAFYPPAVFYIEHERLKRLEESAYGFEYVKFEYLPAPRRTDQVIAFLESEKPARTFVWVHYMEPHEPYDPHPGGPGPTSSDRDRYDGEVRFVDQELERLVGYLERTRPGALIILAADHGEEFSEHGGRYHGTSLYEEQVHIPLLFIDLAPTPTLTPRQVAQPVGLIDVGPTLLGLLDIERSARMRGRDLSPWLLSAKTALPLDPVFAEIGRQKMVMLGEKKLICDLATDTCQGYDLGRDPLEQHNTVDSDPQTALRLRGALDRFLDEARRFEAGAQGPGGEPTVGTAAAATAIGRAQLGDRSAIPGLLALLESGADPATQRRALALLGSLLASTPLPSDGRPDPLRLDPQLLAPSTIALLTQRFTAAAAIHDAEPQRWAAIAMARLGLDPETAAGRPSSALAALTGDELATAEQRLSGALALAGLGACSRAQPPRELDCVGSWLAALPSALSLQDRERVRPLLVLLGRSQDRRVRRPLEQQLQTVLSRADVVAALGALGDRAAVPALARVLSDDPYVHVRAAAATALGQLGGPAVQAALLSAASREREAPVQAAVAAARARAAH